MNSDGEEIPEESWHSDMMDSHDINAGLSDLEDDGEASGSQKGGLSAEIPDDSSLDKMVEEVDDILGYSQRNIASLPTVFKERSPLGMHQSQTRNQSPLSHLRQHNRN